MRRVSLYPIFILTSSSLSHLSMVRKPDTCRISKTPFKSFLHWWKTTNCVSCNWYWKLQSKGKVGNRNQHFRFCDFHYNRLKKWPDDRWGTMLLLRRYGEVGRRNEPGRGSEGRNLFIVCRDARHIKTPLIYSRLGRTDDALTKDSSIQFPIFEGHKRGQHNGPIGWQPTRHKKNWRATPVEMGMTESRNECEKGSVQDEKVEYIKIVNVKLILYMLQQIRTVLKVWRTIKGRT